MSHRVFFTMLGPAVSVLVLSLATGAAIAGDVYQWKDANGITHYSESPPPKGAYKQRSITSTGQAESAPVAATKAEAENPQCATARRNIELLQGSGALQQDINGDGKPDRTLTETDRANQMELARAAVKATCTNATASSP